MNKKNHLYPNQLIKLRLVFIFAIAITLNSCDGHTKREWNITNNSSNTIFLEADSMIWNQAIAPIPAGQTSTILVRDVIRGESFAGNPVVEGNLLIFNSEDTLLKDVNSESNWRTDSEQIKKYPSKYEHIFSFELNDSDF